MTNGEYKNNISPAEEFVYSLMAAFIHAFVYV